MIGHINRQTPKQRILLYVSVYGDLRVFFFFFKKEIKHINNFGLNPGLELSTPDIAYKIGPLSSKLPLCTAVICSTLIEEIVNFSGE